MAPAVVESVDGAQSADPADADVGTTSRPASSTATKGGFRKTDEGFDWRCPRCEEWTPLEITSCRVCALPFRDSMSGPTAEVQPQIAPATMLAVSAVAPGLGHILWGRGGTGAMRLMLFLLFFLGGVTLLAQSNGVAAAQLGSAPLLLGSIVIWAATLVDAKSLADGHDRAVLAPRVYLWLTVGVLVLTLVSVLPSALKIGNRTVDEVPAPSITERVSEPPANPSVGPSLTPVPTASEQAS